LSAPASGSAQAGASAPVDARELSRLRWRCRRGLLENDLLIERFFASHAASLTQSQARGLQVLMDLADNDLLDLLLGRTQPAGDLTDPEVAGVLALLRPAAGTAARIADTFISPPTVPTPAARNPDDTV
jgi:antitoxin CptB